MPVLADVKETSLYVDDLERAMAFYKDVLGLCSLFEDQRMCALDVAGRHVLLLFRRGASLVESQLPGGTIPAHDGAGPIHAAFAIDRDELAEWDAHLQSHGVTIVSRVTWPRGGQSIYFHDPDDHVLELLTPGVWATY